MEYNSKKIEISIIMPTYNAEATIEKVLQSIRNQKDISEEIVEILIIDGGSTDKTTEIARRYNAKILFNEKRMPEAAKNIGVLKAIGKWAMFLDSDEILIDPYSLIRRLEFLKSNPNISYLATSGIQSEKSANGVVRYANRVGDPFSNFVYYSYNGEDRIETAKKLYTYEKKDNGYIFFYAKDQLLPLYDAKGDMFSLMLAKKLYDRSFDKVNFAGTIFDQICEKTKCAAILENDPVLHIPRMTGFTYREKLKWRIKNNLYGSETGTGFATRREIKKGLIVRQYMFVMYCLLIIPPLIDSIRLVIKTHDMYFFLHFVWTEYVFGMIGYFILRKLLKMPLYMDTSYAKKER